MTVYRYRSGQWVYYHGDLYVVDDAYSDSVLITRGLVCSNGSAPAHQVHISEVIPEDVAITDAVNDGMIIISLGTN